MKKIILTLTVTLAIIIICFSIYETTTAAKTPFCVDYSSDPISTLPIEVIKEMTKTYENNQLKHIESNMSMQDSKAIWFDLVRLKRFIYHIEQKTKDIDPTVTDTQLGIRIYYASYPNNAKYIKDQIGLSDAKSANYTQKHTLVMIPTVRANNETTNYDFNPIDPGTYRSNSLSSSVGYGWQPNDNDQHDPNKSPKNIYMSLGYSRTENDSDAAINHGGLFPPGDAKGLFFIEN